MIEAVSFASFAFVYEHVASAQPLEYVYVVPVSPTGHADIVDAASRVNDIVLKSNGPAIEI